MTKSFIEKELCIALDDTMRRKFGEKIERPVFG